MERILVVCEGNICRSPMAEGFLAARLPQVRVSSAGLNALIGMPADEMAVRLMRAHGIDIAPHRAKQVSRELCEQSELVLVMSSSQRIQLEEDYPTIRGRAHRVCEFRNCDVPDPYCGPEQAFREALLLIQDGIREWVTRIQKI